MKKTISATFSNRLLIEFLLLIEMNERTQLVINIKIANAVSSSMKVEPFIERILRDVSTIKQSPKRFAEVFKMCGDLLFISFIYVLSG